MTINCSKCGAANEDFAEFCASCGEPVKKEEEIKKSPIAEESSDDQADETSTTSDKKESKIYRSRTNKIVSGLSAGFAKEFNMEVDLIRILWVIFFVLTGGAAIIVYIILWAIIPFEPKSAVVNDAKSKRKEK
ncbi:MAG: PspC domain-containing protein [Asgard group archaeon]|nr:PspC domain-containing protein [Asgard group archaeon]